VLALLASRRSRRRALLLCAVPSSFVPPEDQGYIVAIAVLPDGATLERTTRTTEQLRHMMDGNKAVENFFSVNGFDFIGGGSKANAATMFLPMVPWEKRQQTSSSCRRSQRQGLRAERRHRVRVQPAGDPGPEPGRRLRGVRAGAQRPDPQRLAQVTGASCRRCSKRPEIGMVNTFFRPTVPQLQVEVDREKALALGVTPTTCSPRCRRRWDRCTSTTSTRPGAPTA
jgi:HAE1 family hydrophobic/amphiphilic exporter-1/multidrug efflux pump